MDKFFHCLLLATIFYGCSYTPHYPQSFIDNLSGDRFDVGCIVFPIGNNKYKIELNQVVRDRVYYEYYRNDYKSYGDFLYALLNQNQMIDIPKVFTYDSFTSSRSIEIMAKGNFMRFKRHYLDSIGADTYQVKRIYKKDEKQILKACFDNGLYVYNSCLDNSYTICATSQLLPEPY